jgi:hypothetical protein
LCQKKRRFWNAYAGAAFNEKGGLPTFAASAKSKGQREESGRSGYQPVFSVVQPQRKSAVSPDCNSIFLLLALTEQKMRQVQNNLRCHAAGKPDIHASHNQINSVNRHLKTGRAILAVQRSRPQQPQNSS